MKKALVLWKSDNNNPKNKNNTRTRRTTTFVKPNTHRRRRRDETVESRRVGGVYTNSQLVGDSFVVSSVLEHTRRHSWPIRLRCAFASPNPSAVVASSTHRNRTVVLFSVNYAFYTVQSTVIIFKDIHELRYSIASYSVSSRLRMMI